MENKAHPHTSELCFLDHMMELIKKEIKFCDDANARQSLFIALDELEERQKFIYDLGKITEKIEELTQLEREQANSAALLDIALKDINVTRAKIYDKEREIEKLERKDICDS